jgi:diguanylate cyclase
MENAARALEICLEESKSKTIDLQRNVDTLRLETLTDPLTLVGSRQRFDESLGATTAAARASGQPFSMLLADIDHFKKFNDWIGHQAGDRARPLAGAIHQHDCQHKRSEKADDGGADRKHRRSFTALRLPFAPLSRRFFELRCAAGLAN